MTIGTKEKDYITSTSRRTSSETNINALNNLSEELDHCIKNQDKALLIFDIDSTLLDTSYRTGGIFKEFARHKEHQNLYPDLCNAIHAWGITHEVYDPIEFINEHSNNFKVEVDSDLAKVLMSFWRKRFFNECWLNQDMPYLGAQDFVHSQLEKGVDIAYLTGREEKTLLQGTIKSLILHGFPYELDSKRTRLMLKKSSAIKDIIYKDEGIAHFKKGYDKVYFIDNEIELVEMALERHPDVKTYVFDSVHSKRSSTKATDLPHLIDGWSLIKDNT